ncbi:MAG: type I phosphomannose isomerase catalytic subunit [Bacillota bacterium]
MLYPLKFKPLYKDYIWGGRNLEKLGKELPDGIVAESWEVSCHKDGQSIIANGIFEGTALVDLVKKFGSRVIGDLMNKEYIENFPLLIKFIDANKDLSVQVHPDDDYAKLVEASYYGKSEMWYIISAEPGAKVVYDLRPGVAGDNIADVLQSKNIKEYLNYIEVSPGDTITVPSGVVHALGEGIVAAEIQQNSNITYRIFDYDRIDSSGKKRELHIEKALDVVDLNFKRRPGKSKSIEFQAGYGFSKSFISVDMHFGVELYNIEDRIAEEADGSRFFIYTFIEGEGIINYNGGTVRVGSSESVMIPAHMGDYIMEGSFKALKSYVPNMLQSFIFPLMKAGYSRDEVLQTVSRI